MPTVYDLKPRFQNRLRPTVRRLARAGVTANQITIGTAVLSTVMGLALVRWPGESVLLWLLPPFLLLRMAFNAVDGMLAREWGQKTALGGILNEVGDAWSDAILYLPLALVGGFSALWQTAAVAIGICAEVAGLASLAVGGGRRYEGPMGKSDRAGWFSLLALWVAAGGPVDPWIPAAQMAIAALGVWTIYNRCRAAQRTIRNAANVLPRPDPSH